MEANETTNLRSVVLQFLLMIGLVGVGYTTFLVVEVASFLVGVAGVALLGVWTPRDGVDVRLPGDLAGEVDVGKFSHWMWRSVSLKRQATTGGGSGGRMGVFGKEEGTPTTFRRTFSVCSF